MHNLNENDNELTTRLKLESVTEAARSVIHLDPVLHL